MIPLILAISFPILLTLIFAIPGIILGIRWFAMISTDGSDIGVGDMKIPTFYASGSARGRRIPEEGEDQAAIFICMPIVGSVFGGIHCAGWFFNFPSSSEAMLWRVSSAVLTGMAFLFPIFLMFFGILGSIFINSTRLPEQYIVTVYSIIILIYVVSRLILLVEAFISLRHLTPGMLALVNWTSFILHI